MVHEDHVVAMEPRHAIQEAEQTNHRSESFHRAILPQDNDLPSVCLAGAAVTQGPRPKEVAHTMPMADLIQHMNNAPASNPAEQNC